MQNNPVKFNLYVRFMQQCIPASHTEPKTLSFSILCKCSFFNMYYKWSVCHSDLTDLVGLSNTHLYNLSIDRSYSLLSIFV